VVEPAAVPAAFAASVVAALLSCLPAIAGCGAAAAVWPVWSEPSVAALASVCVVADDLPVEPFGLTGAGAGTTVVAVGSVLAA
jgi:hypothetical protein